MRNADTKVLEIVDGKVFYLSRPIPRADPETFQLIGGDWGRDARHVYFANQRCTKIDAPSFLRLNQSYGVDKNGAHFRMVFLADADAATFQVLDCGLMIYDGFTHFGGEDTRGYARDSRQVWYGHLKVRDADAATFCSLGNGFGRDAAHAYREEKGIVGADATSWRHWRGEMSLDEKHVFWRTKTVEGIDRRSVTLLAARDCIMDRHGIIHESERISLDDYLKILAREQELLDWEKEWLRDGRLHDRLLDEWPHTQ